MEVHPDIEKLIGAKSWEVVDLESTGAQIPRLNVVVTFKRRDTPSEWTLGNDFAAGYMGNSDPFTFSQFPLLGWFGTPVVTILLLGSGV